MSEFKFAKEEFRSEEFQSREGFIDYNQFTNNALYNPYYEKNVRQEISTDQPEGPASSIQNAPEQRQRISSVNSLASDSTEQSDRLEKSPEPPRKRGRKPFQRTTFSDFQIENLNHKFLHKRYLTMQERAELAEQLTISEAQVKVWFQNRRAKEKRRPVSGHITSTKVPYILQKEFLGFPDAKDDINNSNVLPYSEQNFKINHPILPTIWNPGFSNYERAHLQQYFVPNYYDQPMRRENMPTIQPQFIDCRSHYYPPGFNTSNTNFDHLPTFSSITVKQAEIEEINIQEELPGNTSLNQSKESVNESDELSEDSSTDGSGHSGTESKSEEDIKTEALEPIYNDENNL